MMLMKLTSFKFDVLNLMFEPYPLFSQAILIRYDEIHSLFQRVILRIHFITKMEFINIIIIIVIKTYTLTFPRAQVVYVSLYMRAV